MIAYLRGKVLTTTAETAILDVNGVGYLLLVSGATLSMAPAVGERMKLYCILNVREDAMELFGFHSREEKRMYERLKGVTGVGSRTALQILSSLSVRDLSIALVTGDANTLTRVPGITPEQRHEIIVKMAEEGIACNVHYKPLPMHTAYKNLGFDIADYPNAYAHFENEITLPLHTCLTDAQIDYVINCYTKILGAYLK